MLEIGQALKDVKRVRSTTSKKMLFSCNKYQIPLRIIEYSVNHAIYRRSVRTCGVRTVPAHLQISRRNKIIGREHPAQDGHVELTPIMHTSSYTFRHLPIPETSDNIPDYYSALRRNQFDGRPNFTRVISEAG